MSTRKAQKPLRLPLSDELASSIAVSLRFYMRGIKENAARYPGVWDEELETAEAHYVAFVGALDVARKAVRS